MLATLVRATAEQILVHGRFQADAHPGHYLVLPGPRLALLDFGCVRELPLETRRAYGQLVGAILTRDAARMTELFARLGFRSRTGDEAARAAFAEMLLGAFRAGADLSAIDPRAQLEEAMALARRHPVAIPDEFVHLGRVFASLGGLLLRFGSRLSLLSLVAPALARAMSG